jgi:hypothetical protein
MINPRYINRIIVLTFLFALLASGALWWQVLDSDSQLRNQAIAQAAQRAEQLDKTVADKIELQVRYVDFAVLELIDAYLQGGKKVFLAHAHQLESRFPPQSILQMSVIGADGYITISTLEVKEQVYLGDREHFRIHRETGESRLFISAPLFGRVSKQWTIQFSRPIHENGKFVGVVVVSTSPAYLQSTLSSAPLGPQDSVAIFRQSGEYMARNARNDEVMGKSVGPNRAFVGPDAAPSGAFRAAANFDGVRRLFHWQRLNEAPLIVVLGLSEQTVLEPVEGYISRRYRQAGVATAILWLFAVGLLVLLGRVRR